MNNDNFNLDINKGQEPQILGYDANNNPIYGYTTPQVQATQPVMQQPTIQTVQQTQTQPQFNLNLETSKSPMQMQVGNMNNELDTIKNSMRQREIALRQHPEVHQIIQNLNIFDEKGIATYGSDSADVINRISDKLLFQVKGLKDKDTGIILKNLNSIMKEFDIDDIKKEPGLMAKLLKTNPMEKIFAKYNSIGERVENIGVKLMEHKSSISNDVTELGNLYEANKQYQMQLEKYIVAGDIVIEELSKAITEAGTIAQQTNSVEDVDRYNRLKLSNDIMKKKVLDLRGSEALAVESMTLIKQLCKNNVYLMIALDSTLMNSIPAFKMAICQAVYAKKSENISRDIDAVKATTEQFVVKTSKNIADTNVKLVKNIGKAFIEADVLEEVANNIIAGSKEVAKVQLELNTQREQSIKQLEDVKAKMILNRSNQNSIEGNRNDTIYLPS